LPDTDIKAEVTKYAENYLVTFGTDKFGDNATDIVITKITGPKNLVETSPGNWEPGPWGKFGDILIVSANYTYKFLFLSIVGISEIKLNSSNSASRMELE
jgi:hypothetical protein